MIEGWQSSQPEPAPEGAKGETMNSNKLSIGTPKAFTLSDQSNAHNEKAAISRKSQKDKARARVWRSFTEIHSGTIRPNLAQADKAIAASRPSKEDLERMDRRSLGVMLQACRTNGSTDAAGPWRGLAGEIADVLARKIGG
jgi:hypothetical protein